MNRVSMAYQTHVCRTDPEGTVLFLHGLGSCGDDWALQTPVFQEHYDVITLDLPGHGASPLPTDFHSVEDLAIAAADVLNQAGKPQAHVVGLSLGGAVALSLALCRPAQVRSLVLVNTFAHLQVDPSGRLRVMQRLLQLLRGDMRGLGETVARGVFPHAEQAELRALAAERLAQNPRKAYMRIVGALRRFDVRDELCRVKAPCLVISGRDDTTVSPAAKRELADQIPNAAWLEVPDSGHATPLDSPRQFNSAVLDFLRAH